MDMKHYKYLGYAMMAAGMLAATSCSDFSDYNEAKLDSTPSGNLTLWENISQSAVSTVVSAMQFWNI